MVDEIQIPEEYSLDDILNDVPKVTVIVRNKEKNFWIRPPTDSERAMSQNAARQKSRILRALLEDPETEEHNLLIKVETENMTDEDVRLVWLTSALFQRIVEINRRSLDNRDDYFVAEPEGKEDGLIPPTNEDLDRYEESKRSQERERLTDLAAQNESIKKELLDQANATPIEDLKKIIYPLIIEQQTSNEWNNQYGLQILVRCTFFDQNLTERAFKSVEEAMRLLNTKDGNKVLQALLEAHSGLQMDPDLLKN